MTLKREQNRNYLSKANLLKYGPARNSKNGNKEAGGINEPLEFQKSFLQKTISNMSFRILCFYSIQILD